MFRKVREIIGGRDATPAEEIRLEEVPGILAAQEEAWDEELRSATRVSREKIMRIRDRLVAAVQQLSGDEREAAFHHKLEKIVKNSLPLFQKAMMTALQKQLPEHDDGFYQACTESLKGCVKGLAGPGRYLRNVFPDEMKEIRILVDEFGKEINNLTPQVAEWRKRKESASALRDAYARAMDMRTFISSLSREIPLVRSEIAVLERLTEEKREIKNSLGRQIAGDSALRETLESEAQAMGDLHEAERDLHLVISTLAHILRKGEKITQRGDITNLARDVRRVITLITEKESSLGTGIIPEVSSILPVISSMIASGEIQLKNQEEKTLFSVPDKIPETLTSILEKRDATRERLEVLHAALAAHPGRVRLAALEHELTGIEASLREKRERAEELEEKEHEIRSGQPGDYAKIEMHLAAILKRNVRLVAE